MLLCFDQTTLRCADFRASATSVPASQETTENWDNQSSEWEQRGKTRAEEIFAIHETIKLLNDDDTLKLFKATLASPSSVQVHQSTVAVARRAMDALCRSFRTPINSASDLKLISLVLGGKSADVSKVISMIDEAVSLLKAEQGDDDGMKAYCIKSFGRTRFRLIRSLATGMRFLTTKISCPTLMLVSSASLKKSSTSPFRK